MNKAQEIEALLKQANEDYYNGSGELMNDDKYDRLKDELAKLKPNIPILEEIGAPAKKNTKLPYYMGSLDKKLENKEISKWATTRKGPFVISDKLDGVSGLLLVDSKGNRSLFTRGDGTHGENISFLLDYMAFPTNIPPNIAVRGEIIIPIKKGASLKKNLEFKNLRSLVSGTVNSVNLRRKEVLAAMDFVVYQAYNTGQQDEQFVQLEKSAAFNCVSHELYDGDLNKEDLSKILMRRKSASKYEMDGIVVSQNIKHSLLQGKNPAHAFAFKSIQTQETAIVTVENVVWEVSKDGYLKPVVMFSPVELSGVTMSRVSGQNAKYILTNKIGKGTTLRVIRSGDVIPYIMEVISSTAALMPDVQYELNETGVDAMLIGESDDYNMKKNEYFLSKIGAKGVSKMTTRKLYEQGFDTIDSIINMTEQDLLNKGFREKTASNIVSAIKDGMAASDEVDIMIARNIFGRGIGEKKLRLILQHIPDLMAKKHDAKLRDRLLTIPGMATKTVDVIIKNIN